jgi:hypothetical protein
MLVSESIFKFWKVHAPNNLDLYKRVAAHLPYLETQINVHAAGGEPAAAGGYTNGTLSWYNVRAVEDKHIAYPLDPYIDCFGFTGWDSRGFSRWVGFDLDHVAYHEGTGISADELQKAKQAACGLDYVEVRNSTRTGTHLYVHLDEVPTADRSEHIALARHVLSVMTRDSGYPFSASVDACGVVLWVYHRHASPDGYKLINAASRSFTDVDGWRDHIEVASGRRAKVRLPGDETIDNLLASYPRIRLDDTHKTIIDKLVDFGFPAAWSADHHCLQTHTVGLKRVHEALSLMGIFETNSPGTDSKPNCFCYPKRDGGFTVIRFHRGTKEHPVWQHDDWTRIDYNADANLAVIARAAGAAEIAKGGYQFPTLAAAVEALKIDVPQNDFADRTAIVASQPVPGTESDRLVIHVPKKKGDTAPGWNDIDKPKYWTYVAGTTTKPDHHEADAIIRCATRSAAHAVEWYVRTEQDDWQTAKREDVKSCLAHHGFSTTEANRIMGWCTVNPWRRASIPFGELEPGDRQWNIDGPQLAYEPASTEGPYPHWKLIFNHCGQEFDEAVAKDPWCQRNGIRTGADLLELMYAVKVQRPAQHLAGLALYGDQNSGKSMYPEAFSYLITKGYEKADRALTQNHNAELIGCLVAHIEEVDVRGNHTARSRIKDYITGDHVAIRDMRKTAEMHQNYTWWIQTTNHLSYIPIDDGDTRFLVATVPKPKKIIAKYKLQEALRDEAPNLIRALLRRELPDPDHDDSRLFVPCLETKTKVDAIQACRDEKQTNLVQEIITVAERSPIIECTAGELARRVNTHSMTIARGWDSWLKAALVYAGAKVTDGINPKKNQAVYTIEMT